MDKKGENKERKIFFSVRFGGGALFQVLFHVESIYLHSNYEGLLCDISCSLENN